MNKEENVRPLPMTREQFCEYMSNVQKLHVASSDLKEKTDGCVDVTEKFDTYPFMKWLAAIFEDKSEWIDYFTYELDWGNGWYSGCVTETDKNGETHDVPLSTFSDLYTLVADNFQNCER